MFSPDTFTRSLAALALLGTLSLTACSSGEPDDGVGEEELITQVDITLRNADDALEVVMITARDADGDGAERRYPAAGCVGIHAPTSPDRLAPGVCPL